MATLGTMQLDIRSLFPEGSPPRSKQVQPLGKRRYRVTIPGWDSTGPTIIDVKANTASEARSMAAKVFGRPLILHTKTVWLDRPKKEQL